MDDVQCNHCLAAQSRLFSQLERHFQWTAPAKPSPLAPISPERRLAASPSAPEPKAGAAEPTVLYLAYGSNLCDATFLATRGIRPLAATNVVVPSLALTFDLPGIPYTEPCFANTALRSPNRGIHPQTSWPKGLVGTVYEVTKADYAHILATEGGGAAYAAVTVQCFPLSAGGPVPRDPTEGGFGACTLFAAAAGPGRIVRPGGAQASARYLGLITTGAGERGLPREYREYLGGLRAYTVTTRGQRVGRVVFGLLWMPLVALLLALNRGMADGEGRAPAWVVALGSAIFRGMWLSYDAVFRPVFGDGERTLGEDDGEPWREGGEYEDVKEEV